MSIIVYTVSSPSIGSMKWMTWMSFTPLSGGFPNPSALLALRQQTWNRIEKRRKWCFQEKEKHFPLGSRSLRRVVMTKRFMRCRYLVVKSDTSQIQNRLCHLCLWIADAKTFCQLDTVRVGSLQQDAHQACSNLRANSWRKHMFDENIWHTDVTELKPGLLSANKSLLTILDPTSLMLFFLIIGEVGHRIDLLLASKSRDYLVCFKAAGESWMSQSTTLREQLVVDFLLCDCKRSQGELRSCDMSSGKAEARGVSSIYSLWLRQEVWWWLLL